MLDHRDFSFPLTDFVGNIAGHHVEAVFSQHNNRQTATGQVLTLLRIHINLVHFLVN